MSFRFQPTDNIIHLFYVYIPYSEIKKFLKKRKMGVTGNDVKPRWELDYDLLENEGLFGEYLEMGVLTSTYSSVTISCI